VRNDARSAWPAASRKRLLLAIYVDWLLVSAPLVIVQALLTRTLPGLAEVPFWTSILFFAALEFVLLDRVQWTPGFWALGIDAHRTSAVPAPEDPGMEKPRYHVDPRILASERWWTVLFGVFAVLSGVQGMTRWTMWSNPIPPIGIDVPWPASVVLTIAVGAAEVAVGICVLRLMAPALPLGVAVYGLQAVVLMLAWPAIPEWAEQQQMARRAYQGLPVRPGELENMRAMAQPMAAGGIAVVSVVMLAVGLRIRRLHRQETAAATDA